MKDENEWNKWIDEDENNNIEKDSEKKEDKMIRILKSKLEENNIIFSDDFEVLVYQSPYKFLNRKNEIIVSINHDY